MADEAFDPFANDDDDDEGFLFEESPNVARDTSYSSSIRKPSTPSSRHHRVRAPQIQTSSSPRRHRLSTDSVISSNINTCINDINGNHHQQQHNRQGQGRSHNNHVDDVLHQISTTFPSMALNDDGNEQFGFSNFFPAEFDARSVKQNKTFVPHRNIHVNERRATADANVEEMVFIVTEEMSVVHKAQSKECSVSIRGTVSVRLNLFAMHP
jgi:hypothetical protein